MDPKQRVENFVNVLRARNIGIESIAQVDNQLYRIEVSSPRPLKIYVAINGVYSYPFEKHTIHDHGLLLALKMNANIDRSRLSTAKSAEELIDRRALLELVDCADSQYLRECFDHIVVLLKALKNNA